MLVLGSNTAKQATLMALLDPSTHFRPPLTHTSHHRPALIDLSRFRVSPILTHSRFRRLSTWTASKLSASTCKNRAVVRALAAASGNDPLLWPLWCLYLQQKTRRRLHGTRLERPVLNGGEKTKVCS
jgi:hypothetical protein